VSEAPTTEELLDAAEARMGLGRRELLLMVAKSATVRHLATDERYKDLFVLKGGTLLSNVYRSPRQSIKDADYTYLDPQTLKAPELERALSIDGDYGFHLTSREVFSFDRDMFAGDAPFSMDGIAMGLRGRDRELKITVSVRAGERLDPPQERLFYSDPLLARDDTFEITGLTRNELSAEKLLGWCSKPLSKHFVDLAYVARDHHEHVDREQVANLVRRKFEVEGGSRRYRELGIRRPSDLVRLFADPKKLRNLSDDWDRLMGAELMFLPGEIQKPPIETLTDPENVVRICLEFWQPTLDLLSGT